MKQSLQSIIANYTRDILVSLHAPDQVAPTQVTEEPSRRPQFALDVSDAQELEGGSLLVGAPASEAVTHWLIYARGTLQTEANRPEFLLRGKIDTALEPIEFISAAYKYVLNRDVDEDGKQIYSSLLADKRLSQRDALSILASSKEAQDKRVRLLIVSAARLDASSRSSEAAASNPPASLVTAA